MSEGIMKWTNSSMDSKVAFSGNGQVIRRRLVKMIVNFYAMLRQVVGSRQVDFVLPQGGTLRQLVEEMIKRYPILKNEMLDPQGNLYGHIHIFVNGRDNSFLDGSLDSILELDDTISIFPPVGGG
jgi:molybdopterin synthase sulfur carrier subunit